VDKPISEASTHARYFIYMREPWLEERCLEVGAFTSDPDPGGPWCPPRGSGPRLKIIRVGVQNSYALVRACFTLTA
jgi:hypothetical protein